MGKAEQLERGRHEIREFAALRQRHPLLREDERYRIRGVCRVRARAVCLEHLLGVAVVGCDQADAARALDRLDDFAEARIGRLDGARHGRNGARVSDHVRIREIDDREDVALADLFAEAACHLSRRHLGLVVVAWYVTGTRHEDACLAGPIVLAAAVEEVRDVCIFLRLGHVQLASAMLGDDLGHGLADVLLLEHDWAGEILVVPRHGGEIELGFQKLDHQLACSVGPEVEENRGVALAEARPVFDRSRHDELVGDAGVVARLHVLQRVMGLCTVARADRFVRQFGPVPALVAVHRVVAARDAGERFFR